jgi:uncharacterized protein
MLTPQTKPFSIRWLKAINEVPQHKWDRLAQPLATPFLEWQWLHQLEASGSICAGTGWQPNHLTLWQKNELVAAAPLYIKTHSEGEFVFDYWLAELAGENNIPYYPKLVGMTPVTPVGGYRFLMDEALDFERTFDYMLTLIDDFCQNEGLSGCHLNYVDPKWHKGLPENKFNAWHHQSYIWQNPGYGSFEDYLQPFKSNQRRNIRRERNQMQDKGIEIHALTGDDIKPEHAAMVYRFYLNTNLQHGPYAAKYLNAEFFNHIFRHYRQRLLLMTAVQTTDQMPVAMSLLVYKAGHLMGRYWGCDQQIKDLHFNLCYYAPIEWAIANGIKTFDPGIGSLHKVYRGFESKKSTSLHRFYEPRLGFIFQHVLTNLNRAEQDHIDQLNARLPFAQR